MLDSSVLAERARAVAAEHASRAGAAVRADDDQVLLRMTEAASEDAEYRRQYRVIPRIKPARCGHLAISFSASALSKSLKTKPGAMVFP